MSLPQPEQDLTRLIEVLDRTFPQVPPHPSHGQQARLVEALRTRTSPQAITAASTASTKRKRCPRPKLDNEKCAKCRKDKVKCNPQPRVWPAKCERCSIKGFECSPGEVKRRAKQKLSPTSLGSPGSEPTLQDDQISETRDQIGQVSVEPHVDNIQASWDYTDLIDMVTVVQLLRYQGSFLATVASRFEKLAPGLVPLEEDNTSIEIRAITQHLPQLTKDIQKIVLDRLHSGDLTMNDRILYENAHEAVDEDFVVPKHDLISKGLPIGIQIRCLVRELRLVIRGPGPYDFSPVYRLVGQLADKAPAWEARFGLPNDKAAVILRYWETITSAVLGLVLSPEFLPEPFILDWVLRYILESDDRTFPRSIPWFAEIWNADDDSVNLSYLAANEKDHSTNLPLLHMAVLCNKPRIVRTLVEGNPDLGCWHTMGWFSAFHFAAFIGSVDCYRTLLRCENAKSVERKENWNGDLPLCTAARNGHKHMVDYILGLHSEDATYVNESSRFGVTPLMKAAESGGYDVVQFLLNYPGVDIAAFDNDGKTALVHANENEDVFRLILSKFTDQYFNTIDESGATPLHFLAEYAGGQAMQSVLSLPSVLPDKVDESGRTPLSYAVRSGNLEAVKVLGNRRDVDVTKLCTGSTNYIYSAKIQARHADHHGCSQVLDWLKMHCKELEADLADWKIRGDTSEEESCGLRGFETEQKASSQQDARID